MDSKRTTEQAEAPGALTPEERRERAARKALQKDTAAWLVKGGIKPRTPEQRKETQAMVDAFLAERGFSLSRPLPPSGHSPQADVHLMAQLSLERIRPAQVIAEGYAVRTGLSAAEAMQELRSAADGRAIGGMYLHTRTDAEGVELWSMMPYQPLSMRAEYRGDAHRAEDAEANQGTQVAAQAGRDVGGGARHKATWRA